MGRISHTPVTSSISIQDIDNAIAALESLLAGNIDTSNIARDNGGRVLAIQTSDITDVDGYIRGKKFIPQPAHLTETMEKLERALENNAMPSVLQANISYKLTQDTREVRESTTSIEDQKFTVYSPLKHKKAIITKTTNDATLERSVMTGKATDYRPLTFAEFFGLVYDHAPDTVTAGLAKEAFVTNQCIFYNVEPNTIAYVDTVDFCGYHYKGSWGETGEILYDYYVGMSYKTEYPSVLPDRIYTRAILTVVTLGGQEGLPDDYFFNLDHKREYLTRLIV